MPGEGAVPGTPTPRSVLTVDAIDSAGWAILGSLGLRPREAAVIADLDVSADSGRDGESADRSGPPRGSREYVTVPLPPVGPAYVTVVTYAHGE